jgi:predicted acyltransferase
MSNGTVSSRLLSLDVFRGITVMAMILVNNPGDWGHIYTPLEHAAWNGCTLADLVFPFFLFIMGISIVFAMETRKADPANHQQLMFKALRRAVIICCLGWFMSIFLNWDFATLRIPGVLPRIGVVYLLCSFIYIKSYYRVQTLLIAVILVGYYILLTQIAVPDTGHASLEPETNLGAWLDRTILGTAHLWKESKTWDPEGLLSTLPAIATGLLGVLTGTWLKQKDQSEQTKVYVMLTSGAILTGLGFLCNVWFPINKALWTSSYVLFTGGLALLCFALCYWVIDVQGYRRFTKPFIVYGVNAITVFVVSGLVARSMNRIMVNYQGRKTSSSNAIYQSLFVPHLAPLNASLAWAIGYVLVWMIVLWAMYNKRIFIKI